MNKTIVIIDGLGGGVGAQLTARLREALGTGVELVALGTNSSATERMLKAGADRGATGENAIRVSVGGGDLIVGPIGIVIPDSMMGEITAAMVAAVLAAGGTRILLPLQQSHLILAGVEDVPLGELIRRAVAQVTAMVHGGRDV
jgi:hypothetical protein